MIKQVAPGADVAGFSNVQRVGAGNPVVAPLAAPIQLFKTNIPTLEEWVPTFFRASGDALPISIFHQQRERAVREIAAIANHLRPY